MNFWASCRTRKQETVVFALVIITLMAIAQHGEAARDDVAVGPSRKASEVYERYASRRVDGYELSPYIVTQIVPQPTPLPGAPPKRYTDLEYSRLILSTLAVPPLQPLISREPNRTIIKTETTPEGLPRYAEAEAEVIDVLNRCILLLDTGENLRLRGVRCFSTRDPDPVIRYYVREATRKLRELTRGQKIRIVLDDPLRDLDGNILGYAYTSEGLELNRFLLEQGYGYVEPSDFYPFQDLTPFYRAETTARQAYRGIWSKEK